MSNGFLDDLPDLGMPARRRKAKGRKDVVMYVRVRCPRCGGDKCPVTHTDPPVGGNQIRYHRCGKCGHTFKSIEENYKPS